MSLIRHPSASSSDQCARSLQEPGRKYLRSGRLSADGGSALCTRSSCQFLEGCLRRGVGTVREELVEVVKEQRVALGQCLTHVVVFADGEAEVLHQEGTAETLSHKSVDVVFLRV